MDELDRRGERDRPLAAVAAEPAREEEQRRAHALAAALLDVAADLRHEPHVGADLLGEDVLHLREVVLDEADDVLQPEDAAVPEGVHRGQVAYR